jgi:hypothetical protein
VAIFNHEGDVRMFRGLNCHANLSGSNSVLACYPHVISPKNT